MWAAFLALTLSAAVQALTGHDHPHRAHGKRPGRELITIPARVVHHARRLILRLAQPGRRTTRSAAGLNSRSGRTRVGKIGRRVARNWSAAMG